MITASGAGGNRPHNYKLYESYNWIYKKYVTEHMSEDEIAVEAGTTQVTIHRWLVKHGLIKRRQ